MGARRVLLLVTLIAGCSRRDEPARGVPESELVRSTPTAPDVPRCEPRCEAGASCVDGLCAEPIDWAFRAAESDESCAVGQRRAVRCTKSIAALATVWGTDTYTTDSAVCAAALHAGKLTLAGGDVVYEIRPGLSAYLGSTRNGVTTNGWGSYGCSYVFTTKGCAAGLATCGGVCANLAIDRVSCGACGNACAAGDSCRGGACSPGLDADWTTTPTGPCSGRRTYACPPLGSATIGTVWGTGVYTNDSSVCGAAVHAGAIAAATGGSVTIELSPGLPSYTGSTHHGITSHPWAAWACSFRFK